MLENLSILCSCIQYLLELAPNLLVSKMRYHCVLALMSSFLSSFAARLQVQQCGVPHVVFPDRIGDEEIYREFGERIEEAVTVSLDRILHSVRTPPNSCQHLAELRPDLRPGYY